MGRRIRVLAFLIVLVSFAVGGKSGDTALLEPVSMFLADNTLYVSDPQTGIHVFDAIPGSAAIPRAIICFPGNTGVAVRDDIVYANSWEGIFALRISAAGQVDTLAGPIAAPYPVHVWNEGITHDNSLGCGCNQFSPQYAAPASGGGSSYAVFAVIDTFLYYLHPNAGSVVAMSISRPDSPKFLGQTEVAWNVETIFPNGRFLLVGAQTGMYILDREPDPVFMRVESQLVHARGCDPVVVEDSLAYVTLRGGTSCGPIEDALLMVSIANPSAPRLLSSASPTSPYGMAVNGPYVYVGNGDVGLSLYYSAPPDSIKLMSHWPWAARDFIWSGSMLYVLEPGGVSTYDVSDPQHPTRLSPRA